MKPDSAAGHADEAGTVDGNTVERKLVDQSPVDGQPGFRYRAFLSYSHVDRRWGRWLMRKIETYRVPKRLVGRGTACGKIPARLAPIFRDRDELSSAGQLGERIDVALRDSQALIVIASPASAASNWVNEEILRFKRLGGEARIHCFIVDGDPDADGPENCFAPALRRRMGADGELSDALVELVAADARSAGDGRQRALTKLIAGLLGVDYDDLRQRELTRRNRRLVAISAASAVGMLVTATLAGLAVVARDDAERRRVQAEDLVGFMLGDLYERLYEIGRVDIYNTIGDKATEYFASLEKEDLTDNSLAQRAEALRLIGETRADQGQLDDALDAFNMALELSMGVTTRQPERIDWQLDLAETHYWVGYVGWRRGDLEAAAENFQKQLAVQEAVLENGGESEDLLREMGYAYTNLGRVEEGRGRLESALDYYQRVLALNQTVSRLATADVDAELEIGFANNNLGVLLMRMGRLADAEPYFREDLRIKSEVAGRDPGNGLWAKYRITSESYLGQVLEYRGAVGEAMGHYQWAQQAAQRQYETADDNHTLARNHANRQRQVGDLWRRLGEYQQATAPVNEALATLQSLRSDHEDDARWLRDLARAQLAAGRLALDSGDVDAAMAQAEEARILILDLLQRSPDDMEFQQVWMDALLLQGEAAAAAGEEARAKDAWMQLVRDMSRQVVDSRDPEWLVPYVVALFHLERPEEAKLYLQRLREMGYTRPGPELALMTGDG
ncbi:MAG: toll/interleukin-1 receptor domain-containing protein [Gammaproteobacteria bacterium]